MGLKRLYEFSKIILLEFAPCMGLKSTEYYEKQKLIFSINYISAEFEHREKLNLTILK